MITVCMLGGPGAPSASVAKYYLAPGQPCGLAYYTERGQLPGRWVTSGAQALGLRGPLGADGAARLEELLNARGPDGQVLARPVWRADPAGRLPGGPLLGALGQEARRRGVPLDELLTEPADRATVLGIIRRTASRNQPFGSDQGREAVLASPAATCASPDRALASTTGRAVGGVLVDAAVAGHVAAAAGLNPVELYRGPDGHDRYSVALAKAGARIDVRRIGIDVTVSAPKSVSVLQALADPETAALIGACHDRAVTQALGYLQRQAGHGFRGHHGDGQVMERVATDGWIAAAFTHYTSRAGDPQLHTHLVVPNLVHGVDGKWSAIDSRAVHWHAKTAGYLYHAALRFELSQQFPISWTKPVKGMAEISHVPTNVLREFSTRRREIEQVLATSGGKGRAAAQAACLATRQRKSHVSLARLQESWVARSSRLGVRPTDLVKVLSPRGRFWHRTPAHQRLSVPEDLNPEQLLAVAEQVLGPAGVTAQRTGFDRRELLQALAVTVPVELGGDAARLEALADQLLTRPDAVPLNPGEQDQERWTTLELLATEYRALDLATTRTSPTANRHGQVHGVLAARPGLAMEQYGAIRVLAADDRFVRVLVGPAGSGKTPVLSAARDLALREGQPVIGCSLAALTAQRLQEASGIPSSSLAALLARVEHGQPLEPHTLVIVDEAGMVGTRDLAQLLEHVHQAAGRVLLVGDPEQLPEIDAGGLFRHLSQPEARPARLVGNQRQQNAWEAGALELLRANRPVAALGEYVRHDRLTIVSSRQEMHEHIAADYVDATAGSVTATQQRQTVVLASQRIDVHELNQHIRARLKGAGRLGADVLEVGVDARAFAIGDEVIVTKQCRDTGGCKVLNGTRGTVTQATAGGLRFLPDHGPAVELDARTVEQSLQHGYALTIHKAQGLTANNALVVSDGLTRQSAYTALSRGRDRNQLYLHHDPDEPADGPSPFQKLSEQLTRCSGDTLASQQVRQLASPVASDRDYEPPREDRSIGR